MIMIAANPVRALPKKFSSIKTKSVKAWKWISSRWIVASVLSAAALSTIAFLMATRDKIVVGPFSVPREYEDRGYTSEAVSNAIVHFIRGNQSKVALRQPTDSIESGASGSGGPEGGSDEVQDVSGLIDGRHVVSSFDQSNIPDIKVPMTSLSVESLVEMVRMTVGRQATRIAGAIVFLNETGATAGSPDLQRSKVLIRYKIEYPEPEYSILGYHWWSRRITTVTDTLTANGAEDVIRKLALIMAEGLGQRTLPHESRTLRAARLVRRGNIHFGLDDYPAAATMYNLANKKSPTGHAYLSLGVIAEQAGNWEDAITAYTAATTTTGDSEDDDADWARLYLGNLMMRKGDRDEAIGEYHSLIGRKPKNTCMNAAWNNLWFCVVQAAAQNNLGFSYWRAKDWAAAMKCFKDAGKIAESVHASAAACAYGDGENSECGDVRSESAMAKRKAEAFLAMDMTNQLAAIALYGQGYTSSRQDKSALSAVEICYRSSIQKDPGYVRAHYRLAGIYLSQNKYKEAINEFQNTIQIDLGYARAYSDWKSLIRRWKSLPGKREADKPLQRTLALDYKLWGDRFSRNGDPDDAVDRYCSAAELDPAYRHLCKAS